MGRHMGCLGWIFFGLFTMISKIFIACVKGLWTLNLYILQLISGKPLYYCELKYLIPAKIIGTLGVISIVVGILSLIVLIKNSNSIKGGGISPISVVFYLVAGSALLFVSRFLIRRGAI